MNGCILSGGACGEPRTSRERFTYFSLAPNLTELSGCPFGALPIAGHTAEREKLFQLDFDFDSALVG